MAELPEAREQAIAEELSPWDLPDGRIYKISPRLNLLSCHIRARRGADPGRGGRSTAISCASTHTKPGALAPPHTDRQAPSPPRWPQGSPNLARLGPGPGRSQSVVGQAGGRGQGETTTLSVQHSKMQKSTAPASNCHGSSYPPIGTVLAAFVTQSSPRGLP